MEYITGHRFSKIKTVAMAAKILAKCDAYAPIYALATSKISRLRNEIAATFAA